MKFLYIPILVALCFSCSYGETEIEVAHNISASFVMTGTNAWPERYTIAFGAFAGTSVTPLAYTAIEKSVENGTVAVAIDVPEKADNVRLYLANSARQIVATFFQHSVEGNTADLQMPVRNVDIVTFGRVQGQVFNSCTACHGGSSGLPAAGLNLVEGQSWKNLVDANSTMSSIKRVTPGDTAKSFLVDVMWQRNLSFVHTASYAIDSEDIELTKLWIAKGALND